MLLSFLWPLLTAPSGCFSIRMDKTKLCATNTLSKCHKKVNNLNLVNLKWYFQFNLELPRSLFQFRSVR